MGRWLILLGLATSALVVSQRPKAVAGPGAAYTGIEKIRHVIVVMQENRSFDSYFGTYPGADGIPRRNGQLRSRLPRSRTPRTIRGPD